MFDIQQFLKLEWQKNRLPQPLFLCLFLCLFCSILLSFLSHWVFPFTTDSLLYISTAQHISSFKGMLYTNIWVESPSPADVVPNIIWPPGYPILIALLKTLGIEEYTASLFLSYVCFIFLPFLFFFVFRKLMSDRLALVSSFVSTFMFSMIHCALMAWTDIPYLCFSLISLVSVFHIIEKKAKVSNVFIGLSGMLAGYAFLIRYIGLSLIASTIIGFLACFLLRMLSIKDFIKTACLYILGICLVVTPYLVRNLVVFGEIQPYHLPHSKISLLTNLHDYFKGLAQILFDKPSLESLTLVILAGVAIYFVIHVKNWAEQKKPCFIYALILLAYFLLNSIFLIVHWTISFGPEHIDERYLIQVTWILAGAIIFYLHAGLKKPILSHPQNIKIVTGLLFFLFLIIQISSASQFFARQKVIKNLSQTVASHVSLIKNLPANYVIVSNVYDITLYFSKRNVRALSFYTPQDLLRLLGAKRKFVVFLIKENEFFFWDGELRKRWKLPDGYNKIFSDECVDIFTPQ